MISQELIKDYKMLLRAYINQIVDSRYVLLRVLKGSYNALKSTQKRFSGRRPPVLDSRIQNLHLLPEKRTDAGIAQAHLAVGVAHAFIRQEVATRDERAGLKLLERVADIASDIAAVRVFLLYGIDPLKAVPLEDFRTTSSLHKIRWPQIVAEVSEKRESLRKLSSRSTRSAK
jgi:hypothetical protein